MNLNVEACFEKKSTDLLYFEKSSVTLALALAYFKTGFKAVHLKKSEPC